MFLGLGYGVVLGGWHPEVRCYGAGGARYGIARHNHLRDVLRVLRPVRSKPRRG